MGLLGWTATNGDPDNFRGVLWTCGFGPSGGQNHAKWCNKDFSDLSTRPRRSRSVRQEAHGPL